MFGGGKVQTDTSGKFNFNTTMENDTDAQGMFNQYIIDGQSDAELGKKGAKFFGDLALSPTGGLSEVPGLFDRGKVGLVMFVGLLLMNIFNVIKADMACINFEQMVAREDWLIHEVWLDKMMPGAYFTPDRMFAYFELIALAIYSLHAVYYVIKILCTDDDHSYRKWTACADLCLRLLPSMQTFSSMRMLQYISPAIFAPALKDCIEKNKTLPKEKWFRKMTAVPVIVISHLLFFIFGFEAFLVKFRQVDKFLTDTEHQGMAVLQLAAFMNQMMGIVMLPIYTKNRLFKFIFGGVDNFLNTDEQYRQDVWKATFMQRVWVASGRKVIPFCSVALTFTDEDFQKLVLDTKQKDQ